MLLGAGADFDVLPELRISTNLNHIWFANTAVVEALRQQADIPNDLGWDYSIAAVYRPWETQNIVLRASGAIFSPDSGFGHLFDTSQDRRFYSVLFNAVLTY